MQMQFVVHPRTYEINGYFFQVLSCCALTDGQAANAAMHFYQTHKLKKKDKGKLIKVITSPDTDTAGIFG
jgi:hypothetical protein